MFINFNHNSLTRLIIKKLKGEESREERLRRVVNKIISYLKIDGLKFNILYKWTISERLVRQNSSLKYFSSLIECLTNGTDMISFGSRSVMFASILLCYEDHC